MRFVPLWVPVSAKSDLDPVFINGFFLALLVIVFSLFVLFFMYRPKKNLCHDVSDHIMLTAPTRSGKGVGLIPPVQHEYKRW